MLLIDDPYATYKLLGAELVKRKYTVTSQREEGRLYTTYTAPWGKSWKTPSSKLYYPFIDSKYYELFKDKAQSYQFVSERSTSIPFTYAFSKSDTLDANQAATLLEQYAPLIVKPNDSLQSRGLTMDIHDEHQLYQAVEAARQVNDSDVVIQQQVVGEEVRFIVVKGKVIAALLRQTPRVIGDGIHSVKELIEEENRQRSTLIFPYISYPQLSGQIIPNTFMQSSAVLGKGEVLELSRATMIRKGCSVYDIIDDIHPSYIQEVESLAKELSVPFFAADFLIQEYRSPAIKGTSWFLEFNSTPSVRLCYGCRDGKMVDIIPVIADLVDETLQQG